MTSPPANSPPLCGTHTMKTYCHYNEDQIRESGILSPERMAEVSAQIDGRLSPAFNAKHQPLLNCMIADLSPEPALMFVRLDDGNAREYMRRSVLPAVLTEAEMTLINEKCMAGWRKAKEVERFSKADKLTAWDGGVFNGDSWFVSIGEMLDDCDDDELPEYVWAASGRAVIPSLSVSEVVEPYVCDCGWEDMDDDDLKGVKELQTALDAFTAANAGVMSFEPDYTKAVLATAWSKRQ